jgi:hypothetical protein
MVEYVLADREDCVVKRGVAAFQLIELLVGDL